MFFRRPRLFVTVLTVFTVLVALVAGIAAWKYQQDLKNDTPVEQYGETVVSPAAPALGEAVRFTVTLKCPWHRKPLEAFCAPAEGLREVGKPLIKGGAIGFGYRLWTVTSTVRPFHTGNIGQGEINIDFNRKGEHNQMTAMKLKLPGFDVSAITPDDVRKLAVAPEIQIAELAGRHKYLIAGVIVLIVLLALGAWVLSRKRVKAAVKLLSPWQMAFVELRDLREAIRNHSMVPEKCMSRLSGVVRVYLEKRFNLRAPQQTTGEFLRDLKRSESPLRQEHRGFLEDFMQSADLVKFAGMPADGELLGKAVDKAEALVSETIPEEEEK